MRSLRGPGWTHYIDQGEGLIGPVVDVSDLAGGPLDNLTPIPCVIHEGGGISRIVAIQKVRSREILLKGAMRESEDILLQRKQ
jgi:hypothetical protein